MNKVDLDITLDHRSTLPLYEQICRQIRQKIEARQLAVGATLPTNHEFCSRLQVSYTTAQQAMATLAREGYVTRMARRGTVVKGVPQRGVVGIYSWMESVGRHDGYYRLSVKHLSHFLEGQERKYRLYLGSESARTSNLACDDLIRHVGSGALSGVVLTLWFPRIEELKAAARISRTPVVSLLLDRQADYSVVYDCEGFLLAAVNYLRQQGRRRVGVIYNRLSESPVTMYCITEILLQTGLKPHPSWLVGGDDTEQGGYEAAGQIPMGELDGLIVMDDVMAMGVDRRLHEMDLRIPSQLTACTFWNHGSRIRLSVPFERFELDVQDQARQAMEILQEALNGRRVSQPHRKLVPMHQPRRASAAREPAMV